MIANVWEKVPNQNFNPLNLTWLGGFTGTSPLGAKTMFSVANTPPANSAANLVKDRTTKVIELGAVGDVSGPLFFRIYHIPYEDLTSYSGANTQLTGLLRGDGQVDVKTYSANWEADSVTGKIHPIMIFSLDKTWGVNPSVPTIGTFIKHHPVSAAAKAAIVADAKVLDAGWGFFAPPHTPSRQAALLRDAISWAFTQPQLTKHFAKVGLAPGHASWQVQLSAIRTGVEPSTVKTMRKYVPLSQGVSS